MGRRSRGGPRRRTDEEIAALREARRLAREAPVDGVALAGFGGLTFAFSGGVELRVEDELGIEGMQWPGGVRLARFCDEAFDRDFWEAATVVELGAGRGLTSCAVAALGCARVYCTDADASPARATVALNAAAMATAPVVRAYRWGEGDAPTADATVVLCGDCMYLRTESSKPNISLRLR